jgi:8-oxo-dGTP pyrophosphatase MutT (NUDIX family)
VTEFELPRVPASAGALLSDGDGRILVVKPTYKAGWTIPGGQMEADGESPWEACRREVREEIGLELSSGRLVCVDFLRPKTHRPGGVRFLFDGGEVSADRRAEIVLQDGELEDHRWVTPDEAAELLSGPVGRRVAAALAALADDLFVYLEDGRPVREVPS